MNRESAMINSAPSRTTKLTTIISLSLIIASTCLVALASAAAQQQTTRSSLAPKLKNAMNNNAAPSNSGAAATRASNLQERAATPTNNSAAGRLDFEEDQLPPDFYELPPEQLDLGMNATGRAPIPMLNVAVLQNGLMVDSAINVHPGTPLEMVIWLDDKSAKVYGLLASSLKAQDDTFRQREQDIISNGCSIETHIFGNFEPNPEDQSLRAKFKAFKFPESNFVRFVGTVNVCIKQCAKVNCGGIRTKRSSSTQNNQKKDDRLVYTVSTVLRITNPISNQFV